MFKAQMSPLFDGKQYKKLNIRGHGNFPTEILIELSCRAGWVSKRGGNKTAPNMGAVTRTKHQLEAISRGMWAAPEAGPH